jgi:hypothetical protein
VLDSSLKRCRSASCLALAPLRTKRARSLTEPRMAHKSRRRVPSVGVGPAQVAIGDRRAWLADPSCTIGNDDLDGQSPSLRTSVRRAGWWTQRAGSRSR